MPTYQYECDACNHSFEIMQSMLDKRLKTCPKCGKDKLYRLIGAGSGIIFKGSGFYETDYKNKGSSSETTDGSKSVTAEKVKTDAQKGAGAAESKPDKEAIKGK